MRTIIVGSRHADLTMERLDDIIQTAGFPVTEIVSGGSGNVDLLGMEWALAHKIPVSYFTAARQAYSLSAGPKRNRQMAKYADALIAIWDGKSKGTLNMIKEATKYELSVFVTEA